MSLNKKVTKNDKDKQTWTKFCSHPQISLPLDLQKTKTNNSFSPYKLELWLNPMGDRTEEYLKIYLKWFQQSKEEKSLTNSSFFLNPVKHSTKFNILAQYSGRQEKGKGWKQEGSSLVNSILLLLNFSHYLYYNTLISSIKNASDTSPGLCIQLYLSSSPADKVTRASPSSTGSSPSFYFLPNPSALHDNF